MPPQPQQQQTVEPRLPPKPVVIRAGVPSAAAGISLLHERRVQEGASAPPRRFLSARVRLVLDCRVVGQEVWRLLVMVVVVEGAGTWRETGDHRLIGARLRAVMDHLRLGTTFWATSPIIFTG